MLEQKIKEIKDISKVDVDILGQGAALYVRVTREESVKKGLSITNQCNRGLEIAARREWNWVKVYQEPKHVGGDQWIDKRHALAELIEDIKTGKIRHVFVRHHDRLWRSAEVQVKLLKIFKEYDVELWDFDRQKDFRSASGKLSLGVEGTVSEYEKDITSERIREMKRGKIRSGRPAGGPPTFGYITQKRLQRELRVKEGLSVEKAYEKACERIPNAREWFIDPVELEVVLFVISAYCHRHPRDVSHCDFDSLSPKTQRRVLAMYDQVDRPSGGCAISRILNANGYMRRSGEAWVSSKILRIINDPVVFGFVAYDEQSYEKKKPSALPKHKQTFYEGQHEAIVKSELWDEVQAVKARNTTMLRTKKKTGSVFPLSHIMICGSCGSPMRAKSQGRDRKFAYYVCRNKCYYGTDVQHNSKACNFPSINVSQAEHAVWEWVVEKMSDPQEIAQLMEKSNQKLKDDQPESKLILEQKRQELVANQDKINKYYSKYEQAKDEIETELAWDKLVELKKEKKQLDEDIELLEQQVKIRETPVVSKKKVNDYVKELKRFLVKNKNKRRVLYQMLQAKHDFKVIANNKYQIEPQLNFLSDQTFIEIDPTKFPSKDDDSHPMPSGDQSRRELAYRYGLDSGQSDHKIMRDFAYRYGISTTRRADHDGIVSTRGGDFERAFDMMLSFDISKIEHVFLSRG